MIDNEDLEELYSVDLGDDGELKHYGTKHHSGRYPWGSGEEPFQSSGEFYTRVKDLYNMGLSPKEVAKILSNDFLVEGEEYTPKEVKSWYFISEHEVKRDAIAYSRSLEADCKYSRSEIGKMVGDKYFNGKAVGESTIRNWIKPNYEAKMQKSVKLATELKDIVDAKKYIDVGEGVETSLGVKSNTLEQAIEILKGEGYEYLPYRQAQVTNPGKWTMSVALCSPGTTHKKLYEARDAAEIENVVDYKEAVTREDGKPNKFQYPASIDLKRVYVRPEEEGGKLMDGVTLIRPGVKDLSLGNSLYAQVRILVNGDRYIKGMAMYGKPEEFPPGVDLIFNSKHKKEENEKDPFGGLKEIKKDDPENPFGAAIKEDGGQSYYDDPNGKYVDPVTGNRQSLSPINKRSDEGDWDAYTKVLPSQFLAKQSKSLINKQLNASKDDKQAEFDEIMLINNPTIRRSMLEDFAEDCDKSAVELKAASLPGQKYKVLIPINTLKDGEVYAPHLDDGQQVALVRYPHGGIFEIPMLTVNNRNKEGIEYLTKAPKDAIGINAKTASQLSGADFDGDYVMCLPIHYKGEIQYKEPLKELVNFEPEEIYGSTSFDKASNIGVNKFGIKFRGMKNTQTEMGIISNLISDMQLKGADDREITRAVKHAMVVIDAEKHHYDYKQSAIDNNIKELKQKYQIHEKDDGYGGASTLISRAGSVKYVPSNRKEGAYFDKERQERVEVYDSEKGLYINKKTGEILEKTQVKRMHTDPKTGQKVYTEPKEVAKYFKAKIETADGKKEDVDVYPDKITGEFYYKNKETGEYIFVPLESVKDFKRYNKSTKMAEASDARELISEFNTVQENLYADYANKLKALANQARLEALSISDNKTNTEAKKEYKEEIENLEYEINQAKANKPKERLAQRIANNKLKAIFEDNPNLDKDHQNKRKQQELKKARALVGATRHEIDITDKEWEAIQNGVLSPTKLKELILYANPDRLRELSLPKNEYSISEPKQRRIDSMIKNGYDTSEIASMLGISESTVTKYRNGGNN